MPRQRSRYAQAIGRRSRFALARPGGRGAIPDQPTPDENPDSAWAPDAYRYVTLVPELGYVVNLKASVLGQCRLVAEELIADEETGKPTWVETEDVRALRVLAAFQPPAGGQGELLRQATFHYEVAGEMYLHGEQVLDETNQPSRVVWEFLSVLELRRGRNGWERQANGTAGGGGVPRPQAAGLAPKRYVRRLHARDGAYSGLADSPVRRVLPICREIVLFEQVITAISKSNLPAGLLFFPDEISFGPEDEFENPGLAEESTDEFEEELDAYLNEATGDRASKATLNPFLLRGPGLLKGPDGDAYPLKDLIGLIDLTRPINTVYQEMRKSAIGRLGEGLDAPPEIMHGRASLSGLGGGNVSDAVDRDWLANHVLPTGHEIVDFITREYFRPMLNVSEGVERDFVPRFRLVLDSSPVTTEADLSAVATTGITLGLVKDEAWLREAGFEPDDRPDDGERLRRQLERLLDAQPTLGPALLPVLFPDLVDPASPMFDKWEVGQSAPGGAQAPPAPGMATDPMSKEIQELTEAIGVLDRRGSG